MKTLEQFYIRQISNVGTENPIVARLTIQTSNLTKIFFEQEMQDRIYEVLGINVKDRLIACYNNYKYILDEIRNIDLEISNRKSDVKKKSYIEIPTIIDLNHKCEDFLYQSKSALRDLCKLFNIFFDESFEEARYDKIYEWAKGKFGENDNLTILLKGDHDSWIRKIISMRNAIEHPGGRSGSLNIKNIETSSGNMFSVPTWKLNEQAEGSILLDMNTFINYMLEFCEDLLIVILEKKNDRFTQITFIEIPKEERDPKCPIRITLGINPEFMDGL